MLDKTNGPIVNLQGHWWTRLQEFPERISLLILMTSFDSCIPSETTSLSASRVKLVGAGAGSSLAPMQLVWISLSQEIRKTTNLTAFRTESKAHFLNFSLPKMLLKIPRKKRQGKRRKKNRWNNKGEERKQHDCVPSCLWEVGRDTCIYCGLLWILWQMICCELF